MSAIYDSIGIGYAATKVANPRIVTRLIELLNLPKGSSLLDVGAGTGNYSFALAGAGFIISLEPSIVMCEQGKTHERLSWHAGWSRPEIYLEKGYQSGILGTGYKFIKISK